MQVINGLEPGISALSDEQLQAKTDRFRERIQQGSSLDDLLPEVFAVVREASRRVLGLRHYDVQLVSGTKHLGWLRYPSASVVAALHLSLGAACVTLQPQGWLRYPSASGVPALPLGLRGWLRYPLALRIAALCCGVRGHVPLEREGGDEGLMLGRMDSLSMWAVC